MDIFSIVGKISINYADAIKGIEKVGDEADKLNGSIGEIGNSMDDAGGKASKFGEKIGSALARAAKIGLAAVTAAATAVTALTGAAINRYGDYEQLVGGVETLFKDASETVQDYASGAFRTAGLSANEYMETVTSFSASLLQGLEGNTAQAAEIANLAITDMSDNANKMGSSMTSIQDAYQGFAKQNYTMLDNLKLGYGGTQSEMIRLINDSGILKEKIDSLDNVSFDQIIQAIHEVQTNMGITGTTAKEAATTIQGSTASMKASWNNLLTGIADGEQDIGILLDQLIDSAMTFGDNILPRIQQTFEGIGEAVEYITPVIMEKLPIVAKSVVPGLLSAALSMVKSFGQAVMSYAPTLMKSGTDAAIKLMNGIGSGIKSGLPTFLSQALPMLVQFSGQLKANAGRLIDAGLNLIVNLAQGIINSIPVLIENVPAIVTNIADIINENAPKLIITAGTIILNLAEGIIQAIPTLIENIPEIIEAIVSVISAFDWMNLGKTVVKGITNGIKSMPGQLRAIAKNAVNFIKAAFSGGGIGNVVSSIFNGIKNTISGGMNAAKSTVSNILNDIKNAFSNVMNGAANIVSGAINKIRGFFNFSWSLPHLKLPHISISGGFSINPPSVPHFGIEWYAKAMEEGMIMNQPTIFGYDAGANKFLAGGESGSETIVGTGSLVDMIKNAVNESNGNVESILIQIRDILKHMDGNMFNVIVKALKEMKVQFDERELARLVRKYA